MIDIIIPAYNALDTISKTLESIVNQTMVKDVFVTIVDDCSSDNYEKVCEEFSKYLNIKLIKLGQNSGPGVSRQIGIDNTTNPYIVFLDADDELYNEFAIKYLYDAIQGYDMSFGKTYYEKYDGFLYFDECLHGKMYRRSFLKEHDITFNSARNHEDNAFNLLWLCTCEKINYVDPIFVVYRYHNNDRSITNNIEEEESVKNYIFSMNWLFNKIEQSEYKYLERIGEAILSTINFLYHNYEKKQYNCDFIIKDSKFFKEEYLKYKDYIKEDFKKMVTREDHLNEISLEDFIDLI